MLPTEYAGLQSGKPSRRFCADADRAAHSRPSPEQHVTHSGGSMSRRSGRARWTRSERRPRDPMSRQSRRCNVGDAGRLAADGYSPFLSPRTRACMYRKEAAGPRSGSYPSIRTGATLDEGEPVLVHALLRPLDPRFDLRRLLPLLGLDHPDEALDVEVRVAKVNVRRVERPKQGPLKARPAR